MCLALCSRVMSLSAKKQGVLIVNTVPVTFNTEHRLPLLNELTYAQRVYKKTHHDMRTFVNSFLLCTDWYSFEKAKTC